MSVDFRGYFLLWLVSISNMYCAEKCWPVLLFQPLNHSYEIYKAS